MRGSRFPRPSLSVSDGHRDWRLLLRTPLIDGRNQMAKYEFRGRLCGTLCGDCFEPLSNVTVRLYSLRADQDATSLAVADPKTTLSVLTDAQVQAKKSALLGE